MKQAQIFGAIGLILYSDPADYAVGGISSVYPDSWWLPGYGVQRGSLYITGVGGDPLTPGYPSLGKVVPGFLVAPWVCYKTGFLVYHRGRR